MAMMTLSTKQVFLPTLQNCNITGILNRMLTDSLLLVFSVLTADSCYSSEYPAEMPT